MAIRNFSVGLCMCLYVFTCGCCQPYNVHIAYGHVISVKSEFARYKIDNIERGLFLVNDYVDIFFFSNSVNSTYFPTNAILILEHPFFRDGKIIIPNCPEMDKNEWLHLYDALGQDAYRGIIEDTPSNRRLIKNRLSRDLAYNGSEMMLSKASAIQLAKAEVSKRGDNKGGYVLKCESYRYNYGWLVYVDKETTDGFQLMSGSTIVTIGDDKQIKDYSYGD